MVVWGKVLLTLLAGGCCGWLMLKKKVPAGILVGAICGSTLLNLCFGSALMPANAKLAAQITTGAFLGCGITREDIRHLPQVARPFAVVIGCFLATNLLMGFLIWWTTPLDLLTSLLCAMPGGVSDTPLIAMDMGRGCTEGGSPPVCAHGFWNRRPARDYRHDRPRRCPKE